MSNKIIYFVQINFKIRKYLQSLLLFFQVSQITANLTTLVNYSKLQENNFFLKSKLKNKEINDVNCVTSTPQLRKE